MNIDMERRPGLWSPAVRLALVVSLIAAAVAVMVSANVDVPQAALVIPVIVVAFVASWIQSGRARPRAVVAPTHRLLERPVNSRQAV
jgi:hypothetical protein